MLMSTAHTSASFVSAQEDSCRAAGSCAVAPCATSPDRRSSASICSHPVKLCLPKANPSLNIKGSTAVDLAAMPTTQPRAGSQPPIVHHHQLGRATAPVAAPGAAGGRGCSGRVSAPTCSSPPQRRRCSCRSCPLWQSSSGQAAA